MDKLIRPYPASCLHWQRMKSPPLPGVDICRVTFYLYTATCSLVSKPEEARRPGIVSEEPIRRRHRRGSDAEIICVWQRMLSTTRAESLGLSPKHSAIGCLYPDTLRSNVQTLGRQGGALLGVSVVQVFFSTSAPFPLPPLCQG